MAKKAGKPKGFAWMKIHDPVRFAALSSKGGTKAQAGGKGWQWDQAQAQSHAVEGGRARWKGVKRKKKQKGNTV